MTATRARDLAAIGILVAVVAWVLVRRYYGALPPLQWFVPLSLGLLGIAELMAARTLRAQIQGTGPRSAVDAILASRALVLAKASAVAGAGFVGLWLGLLAYTAPNLGFLAAAANDTVTGVIGVLSSALLVAGALVLENACRTPRPPEDRRDRP